MTTLPNVDERHALLVRRAAHVFGDLVVGLNWLYEPNEVLDGRMPVECADDQALYERVEQLLWKTEHNVL